MRKSVVLFLMVAVVSSFCFTITGCHDKKSAAQDTISVDTAKIDTTAIDTLENIIAETPMPKSADELFDDFFFNFAANRKLQMKRIKFPLPEYRGKNVTQIQKSQWRTEHFFMQQDYYTLIFDNAKQLNVVKDTTIDHVVVEKVFFKIKTVKQYVFDRLNGQWMLTGILYKGLSENHNASFLRFYQRFVTDSAFQIHCVENPLAFTGPDPDDDFGTMTGTLEPEQWSSFAPQLPGNFIYNILYGQKYTESNEKVFVIRGIANGLETELTFKRRRGQWKLVKLVM